MRRKRKACLIVSASHLPPHPPGGFFLLVRPLALIDLAPFADAGMHTRFSVLRESFALFAVKSLPIRARFRASLPRRAYRPQLEVLCQFCILGTLCV